MTTATPVASKLDPITFEVLRRGFEYASERMSQILQKASFSPIIYDMVDYSNAVFDANTELVGQTANCPIHIAAMHFSARESLREYPLDTLAEGDVIILNDPYRGGSHIPDVTMTMPIFFEGEILGFAVSRAHWTDLGGGVSSHVAGEGLRIPPLLLVRQGELNTDLVSIIRNATRTPQYIDGDIQAQLGALNVGAEEMLRLAEKYGVDVMRQGMAEVLDHTQRMTQAAIERIPDGVYEGADYVDSDGYSEDAVWVRAKVTVKGDRLEVDLSGSDASTVGPINSPFANTASAIYYSTRFFLNPNSPANAGMYRQIDMVIPEGTWLNPAWPAPTVGCTTSAASKVCSAIWQALAHAIPEQIVAPTFADCNWFTASAKDPVTGELAVFSDLPAGGWGGTPITDGMHVTHDPLGNSACLSAEIAELLHPIRYNAFELLTDSPGAGKFRGGCGARLEVQFIGEGEIIMMESSRTREGSPGVLGGGRAARQSQRRRRVDGSLETVGGPTEDGSWLPQMLGGVRFAAGESFVFESGGGGGWGSPLERDAATVAEDVRNEIVSVQQARDVYGVVLTANGDVDDEATGRRRDELAAQAA